MANIDASVPMSKVMANVTMHVVVTGVKTMRVRMWVAMQLFKLGARLCGCGIEFDGRRQLTKGAD